MDYETAGGSQFSLREIFLDDDDVTTFQYTSVTAFIQGEAYAGKLDLRMEDVDAIEALECIHPVPVENISPLFPDSFTEAPNTPELDSDWYYFKSPSFTYEDSAPGCTFVADCLLNEATALEKVSKHPHPNIAKYEGCVLEKGRIVHLCLKRYPHSLSSVRKELSAHERAAILEGITLAMRHLHSLGLAHNDISPENVCLDENGVPILVDFDSCLQFGELLMKGTAGDGEPISSIENDLDGLVGLGNYLGLVADTAELRPLASGVDNGLPGENNHS